MSGISLSSELDNKGGKQEPKPSLGQRLAGSWSRIIPFALVFLVACSLLFGELGKYPLFNPDEALYAEPAREMLEIGDYITTYLNYVVRFTKPPLVIWAQALSILAFGVNEFAVRFFGATCGVLLIAATYIFAERFINIRAAVVSALALCLAPLFIGTAREAITDMPLCFFMAVAMMLFYSAIRLKRNSQLWLAYIFVGLAVMTKGPVGLILPAGILFAYHLLKGDFFPGNILATIRLYKPLPGLAIISLISAPWFITEIVITKGAYFNEFIMKENVQRYTSVVDSHRGAWWYHLAAMFGGSLPLSVFLPQSIFSELRLSSLSEAWKKRSVIAWQNTYKNADGSSSLGLYAVVCVMVTLVFFSTSVSKLLPYTLPAFPFLAILLALEFERIISSQKILRAAVPMILLALAFGSLSSVLPLFINKLRDAPEGLLTLATSFLSFEAVFCLLSLVLLSKRWFKLAYFVFVIPTLMAFLFFGGKILSTLSQSWEGPLPALAEYAAVSTYPILVYDMRKPSIPFYTKRQIIQPSDPEQLMELLKTNPAAYILSKAKKRDFFQQISGCKIVQESGRYLLVLYRQPETKVRPNAKH